MTTDIKEIKELAKRFSSEQIEGCITKQIGTGKNICVRSQSTEKIIYELSGAQFIRDLIGKGMSFAEALRELARRMRLVKKGFKGEEK